MADRIVVFDFAGTLIKAKVIEEANKFMAKILKRSLPSKDEHSKPLELYKANNEFVEKLTGLSKEMIIHYRENNLEFMNISGEKYQNQLSTNLFQIGMFMAAKKHGLNIMQKGMISELERIKALGFRLAIVSGVRTDIISGMLQIAKVPVVFDYIYAQPPILGVSNEENLAKLRNIEFIVGDKLNDLQAAKKIGAKAIFVSWGHSSGGEKEFADYAVDKPKDLRKIIR